MRCGSFAVVYEAVSSQIEASLRGRALRDRLCGHLQQSTALLAGSLQSSQASGAIVRTVGMLRYHGEISISLKNARYYPKSKAHLFYLNNE
jgi:hypothetical protein